MNRLRRGVIGILVLLVAMMMTTTTKSLHLQNDGHDDLWKAELYISLTFWLKIKLGRKRRWQCGNQRAERLPPPAMQLRNRHNGMVDENELGKESEPKTDESAPLISEEEKSASSQPSRVRPVADARFNPPPPSPYKRIGLVLFLAFLFWAGFKLRTALVLSKHPKIIHASR